MAEWLSYLDRLSAADEKGLLLPAPQPSLFARLKARAARVTWDSWG